MFLLKTEAGRKGQGSFLPIFTVEVPLKNHKAFVISWMGHLGFSLDVDQLPASKIGFSRCPGDDAVTVFTSAEYRKSVNLTHCGTFCVDLNQPFLYSPLVEVFPQAGSILTLSDGFRDIFTSHCVVFSGVSPVVGLVDDVRDVLQNCRQFVSILSESARVVDQTSHRCLIKWA